MLLLIFLNLHRYLALLQYLIILCRNRLYFKTLLRLSRYHRVFRFYTMLFFALRLFYRFLFEFLLFFRIHSGFGKRGLLLFCLFLIFLISLFLNFNISHLPCCKLNIDSIWFLPFVILALKLVSIQENLLSLSVLKIIGEFSFIICFVWVGPLSMTWSQSILELAFVSVSIFPNVFSFSVRLSFVILSNIFVSIDVLLSSLTLF